MASRVCPACGGLNGATERTCYRCHRRLPGPLAGWLSNFVPRELVVSRGFTLVCLAVFALMLAKDQRLPVAPEFGFGDAFRSSTLLRFGALLYLPGAPLEVFRLLSAVFVHFSLLHLSFNLWGMLRFSASFEQHFGAARALLILLVTGVGGFMTSVAWGAIVNSPQLTAGASGALFGQFGAYIGVLITRKDPGWKEALQQQLIFAAILALLFRTNTAAHLGGFLVGLGLGMLFERERRTPVKSTLFGVAAALGAAATVAAFALALSSPLPALIAAQEARWLD